MDRGLADGDEFKATMPPFGKPLVFAPAGNTPCEAGVVWLHGYGDGPEGWAASLQGARRAHPHWKWIHMRAPLLPQTCAGGQRILAWGDYLEEGCTRVGSADYDSPDSQGWFEATAREVQRIVDALESEDGIPPERVVVAGFSQGAAAAAESALRYPRTLAGFAMLSGWLLPAARRAIETSPNRQAPVFISHSTGDEMVAFDCSKEAVKLLREAGVSVRFAVLERLLHVEAGAHAVDRVIHFLSTVLEPGMA